MTTRTLIRWGGLVSILFGAVFAISAIINVNGRTVPGMWLALAGLVLVVFAMIALYAAQVERSGVPGLLGFVLTMVGATLSPIGAFAILARVSGLDANREVIRFFNTSPLGLIANFGFGLGLIVFGLATFRANVLPRYAGLLLALGSLIAFVADIAGLPPVAGAIAFVLVGAGFAWMGWALFSRKPEMAEQAKPALSNAQV